MEVADPAEALRLGLRACRSGRWREGYLLLTELVRAEDGKGRLPPTVYGYLGQAIARCEGRKRMGLDLALHAVEKAPYSPESHGNLAAVYLMFGHRKRALRALDEGLALDPDHPELVALRSEIGLRRSPPIPFLHRRHPVNRLIGRLTWRRELRRRERAAHLSEEELLARLAGDRG